MKTKYYKFYDENGNAKLSEREHSSLKPLGYFDSIEEAKADFTRVKGIALARAQEILTELQAMKKRLKFYIGYTYEGDTHGIYDEYQYISFKVEDYEFIVKMESE